MSEVTPEEVVPPSISRARKLYALTRIKVEVVGLKVAEKVLRARTLRLLAVEAAGALAVFHGVDLYSNRVAFILLGAGVIFAIERQ